MLFTVCDKCKQMITLGNNLYEQERKYSFQTYLNFLSEENDTKRNIIAPKPDIIKDIIWDYRQALLG